MTSALTRLSGSAFELTLTLPWSDVKRVYDQVFEELAGEIEIEGFRKGKAPKSVVEGKIDKSKVFGEVVNRILPESYSKGLEEHGLHPIVAPKVQITPMDIGDEKDWQFLVRSSEKPSVELGDYKEAIKTINAKVKLWVPGKDEDKDKVSEEDKNKRAGEIIEKLLEVCKVELAEVLLETEVSRLMTQLVDDVRSAGLTFEQYLSAKSLTSEAVHNNYRDSAEKSLKLEFILGAVADDLKIEVSQAELDEVIGKEPDETKKTALKDQSYVLSSILRREKTLTSLLTL